MLDQCLCACKDVSWNSGGTDISSLDLKWLRSKLALVEQEPHAEPATSCQLLMFIMPERPWNALIVARISVGFSPGANPLPGSCVRQYRYGKHHACHKGGCGECCETGWHLKVTHGPPSSDVSVDFLHTACSFSAAFW